MNLFRTLSGAALVCLSGASLTSCLNAPDYAIEPAIDFKDLQIVHVPRSGNISAHDTLKFSLDFRDGDGDLGLSSTDTSGVYAYKNGTNRFNNNYFIQPYVKDGNGNFVPLVNLSVGEYNGRYPRLDGTDAKPAPLKGVLRYKMIIPINGTTFFNRQDIKFDISIADRALHESNKITTSVVTLGL